MARDLLQQMLDYKEIIELKARFGRLADVKDWMGYGREYETYRKVDGKWKIAHWRLRYDRLDPWPRQPLPTTFLGGPDVMRDENYVKSVVDPRGT